MNIILLYCIKQRDIRCAYMSTNSKIYDILQWWCLPACWGLCNSCGQHTKGSGMAGAAYAAPGKLWGPLECPQWWLHPP